VERSRLTCRLRRWHRCRGLCEGSSHQRSTDQRSTRRRKHSRSRGRGGVGLTWRRRHRPGQQDPSDANTPLPQHTNAPTHQYTNTSIHNTPTHQYTNTPTHQHTNTPTHQHTSTPTHQHTNSPPLSRSFVVRANYYCAAAASAVQDQLLCKDKIRQASQ
jgi:hypothetical protein